MTEMIIDPSMVHYRLIEWEGDVTVVCVQDFDYPDYTFWCETLFATEREAQESADFENYPYPDYDPPCGCWCETCGCHGVCDESVENYDREEDD